MDIHERTKFARYRRRTSTDHWQSSTAWSDCAKALREYDEDMIQDWKEEIDTLLVFAGLFSAVLTAFIVESYALLQEQPEDAAVALLSQMSMQLNSFSVTPTVVNSTTGFAPPKPFVASALAVRLNTLWFSSLICSLLSASLGLLVKQWLREYLAGSSNISRDSLRIRQYRFEALRRWRVPEITLCLPILLQTALLLFFVGMLDFLWSLHPVVAGVVTSILSVSIIFSLITILLPPLFTDCPYKSPQSWLLCALAQSLKEFVVKVALYYYGHFQEVVGDPHASKLELSLNVKISGAVTSWLYHLSLQRPYASWKEREMAYIEQTAPALDTSTLAAADATFMDDAFLHTVVRSCMADLEPHAAYHCLTRIILRRAPRMVNDLPYWETSDAEDRGTVTLMHIMLDVVAKLHADPSADAADANEEPLRLVLGLILRLVRVIPYEAHTHELFRRVFDVLAPVLGSPSGSLVHDRVFQLMLRLFQRFQAVSPTCIKAFCSYARRARSSNLPYRFIQICYMAISASAALAPLPSGKPRTPTSFLSDLDSESRPDYRDCEPPDGGAPAASDGEYLAVRPALLGILRELEGFLWAPISRTSEFLPPMSMRALCAQATFALASRDRACVSPGLVRALEEIVACPDPGLADGGGGAEMEAACRPDSVYDGHAHVARQAVRTLRRMYRLG